MATVHVSNISPQTSEKEVRDFFSYCGKITHLSMKPSHQDEGAPLSATITYERESAAETARLLDNTQLGAKAVKVEAASTLGELSRGKEATGEADEPNSIRQEDKPRIAILAEYLAKGYVVGDQALQKGIELDNKHGISNKFKTYLGHIENKLHPVGTARSVDETYGVTDKAWQGVGLAQRYFEKAIGTPTGQKVRSFYLEGQKQALDIHNEARRLADLQKGESQNCLCTKDGKNCECPHGECTCANCNSTSKTGTSSSSTRAAGEAGEKSSCTCKGDGTKCTCAPGQCGCAGCSM